MTSITYRGSFVLNDGYGRIANTMVIELLERGWDVYLNDINEEKYTRARAHPLIALNYDQLFVHMNTEFQVNHFPPTHFPPRVSSKTKTVLYTTFETTHPPMEWKERIERTSKALLVTSSWVKEQFENALDIQIPVHVLLHGFDQPPFDYLKVAAKWADIEPLRFLMVAANPFDDRKNGWSALRAFQLAFPKLENAPVEFWIIGHGMPNMYSDDPRILFIRGDLSDSALHRMYQMCHVFVAPSRGEGFCLPVFESMHFGMVPIITDWSTPGQLITDDMAFKIPVKDLIPVIEGIANPYKAMFFGTRSNLGSWANPSFHHLVTALRKCYEDRDYLLPMAWVGNKYVSRFTIPQMVSDLEKILYEL